MSLFKKYVKSDIKWKKKLWKVKLFCLAGVFYETCVKTEVLNGKSFVDAIY